MKVLIAPVQAYLNPSYGSEVSWAYNIVSTLAMMYKIDLNIVCGKCEDAFFPSNVKLFEVGFSKGVLFNRSLFYLGCYSIAKKLYKKVDIVHHMFPFGYKTGINLLAICRHLRTKPFIIGPIQYPQLYTDIYDYIWVSERYGLKAKLAYTLDSQILPIIREPVSHFNEITLSEAEALVFDSKKTLDLYLSLYHDIINGKILKVIQTGVEIDMFKYAPLVDKDNYEILTVGNIIKRKGIQYLIEAMPIILKDLHNIKLKIVGDGPYLSELMSLVKRLSLNNFISFEGKISRNKLVNFYTNCDIYVHPSLSEAFPSTIREAMSVGRPVVATDVGVIGEYLKDGKNGFLVQPKNSQMLANKITTLLSNRELRIKIGKKARKYSEENFKWENISKQLYQLYENLISELF